MDFRRLEDLIRNGGAAASGNPFVDTRDQISAAVPPTGLRLVPSIGVIHVEWEPALSRGIRYYEIQFSSSNSFSDDVTTGQPTGLSYTFHAGDPDTTYYVRVRTLLVSNELSVWSSTLNTTTGLATSSDLDPQAASAIWTLRDETEPIIIDTAPWSTTARYTTQELTVEVFGGVIIPSVIVVGDMFSAFSASPPGYPTVMMELLYDGVLLGDQYENTVYSGGYTVPFGVSGFVAPHEPPAGEHTYAVRITVDDPGETVGITLYVQAIQLDILELKR